MRKTIDAIRSERRASEIRSGTKQGYWLVKGYDRHFVSDGVNARALEAVCDRVLSDKVGWDYWIDYCYGYDVHGNVAWSNVDHTDKFI